MLFTTLSLLLAPASLVYAQDTAYTTETRPFFTTGVVGEGGLSSESTLPMPCSEGCLRPASAYYGCFINTTSIDGSGTVNQTECNDYFCTQDNFIQLSQCLNCIVANGDERPFGYSSNTSMTAAPTENADSAIPYFNPMGLINAEQSNGWLKNVTERCQGINRPVEGASTVTAIPTTTGPYFTEYSSGQTINQPKWTGLSQYTVPSVTISYPVTLLASNGASSSSGSSSGSLASTPSASASASAQSGSQPSNGASDIRVGSAGLGLSGLLFAWAMM